MKQIVIALIVILTLSCKNETAKTTGELKSETVMEDANEFTITMKIKTDKEDEIKLMMNNIVIDEFQKKNIQIIEKLIPNTSAEILTAYFGSDLSNTFQINLGNKEVKNIEIESINITYGGNSLEITAENITKYFNLNKYVTLAEGSNTFSTSRVDGKHSPTLVLKRRTINELRKEVAKN